MFNADDARYMAQALRLAERGALTVRPNPAVGCVIVNNGVVVGEGWHQQAGTPHAEVHALRMAGDLARGATAYVTLEPCSHHGRTPPCADALVAAGVLRVVVAMKDPNPLVSGRGLARLSAAGVQVSSGLMEASARQLNLGFLSRMERQRPYVRVKLAASLDGRTALSNGQSKWITSEAARADVQQLRALSGAIVTGVNTIIADDPALNVRLPAFESFQPLRVVLDTHLRTPVDAQFVRLSGAVLIVCRQEALQDDPVKVSQFEAQGVTVLGLPVQADGRLCLTELCHLLATRYAINDLLVEAGATLSGAFVDQGLVDELWWYQAASVMGHDARAGMLLPCIHQMSDVLRWHVVQRRQVGDDWRLVLTRV